MRINPYEILGVKEDASLEEVKKAYYELVKRYHPDKNPGDKSAERIFRLIKTAYEEIVKEKKEGRRHEERAETIREERETSRRPRGEKVNFKTSFSQKVIEKVVDCPECQGKGKVGSLLKRRCRVCKGKGKVKVVSPAPGWKWCPVCEGSGVNPDLVSKVAGIRCFACKGERVVPDIRGPICSQCGGRGWQPGFFVGERVVCFNCKGTGVDLTAMKKSYY